MKNLEPGDIVQFSATWNDSAKYVVLRWELFPLPSNNYAGTVRLKPLTTSDIFPRLPPGGDFTAYVGHLIKDEFMSAVSHAQKQRD